MPLSSTVRPFGWFILASLGFPSTCPEYPSADPATSLGLLSAVLQNLRMANHKCSHKLTQNKLQITNQNANYIHQKLKRAIIKASNIKSTYKETKKKRSYKGYYWQSLESKAPHGVELLQSKAQFQACFHQILSPQYIHFQTSSSDDQ